MALKITLTAEAAEVIKFQHSGRRIRFNDHGIKIDQMRIIGDGSLSRTDAVRIVASRTGDLFFKMLTMEWEAFIGEDAVSAVTSIAQRIGISAFRRIILCRIVFGQKRRIRGSMRPFNA